MFDDWQYKGFGKEYPLWAEAALSDDVDMLKQYFPQISQNEMELDIQKSNGTNSDMFDLMRKLKGNYQILGLTNYSHEKLLETYKKYPEFEMIEGVVDSGTEHIMKPDPRLYQILLDRYHLIPNEAVFIDDRPENIETAINLGINGIIFQSNEQVKTDLRKLGVKF